MARTNATKGLREMEVFLQNGVANLPFPSHLFGNQLPTSLLSLASNFRQHHIHSNHLIMQNNLVPKSVLGKTLVMILRVQRLNAFSETMVYSLSKREL